MKKTTSLKRRVTNYIYNLQCKFCDWLQKQLYDEYTWQELEDKCYQLESKVEELESQLEYYEELEECRRYRRYA